MSVNLNNATPAAPAGTVNVTFQNDGSGNISAYTGAIPNIGAVNLTGQTAAITATTLFTPSATGFCRLSIYLKVTTPDGASSTLGGSSGVTITYTDGTDSVSQSVVAGLFKETGAASINNAGNLTTTVLQGSVVIFALTAVAVQFAIGYTSGTPATMTYEAHLRAESL